jgi:tetratricopeptide (TPR) repeat protein
VYFRKQAESAAERHGTGSILAWLASVELELDNYRSALTWALTQGNDPIVGGAIAGALKSLWYTAGLTVEGRYWVERALEAVSEAEEPHVAARLQSALSGFFSGKRSRDAAERATELYTKLGDVRRAARAQQSLAFALYQMGELDAARVAIAQALEASRACDDAVNVSDALNTQACMEVGRGAVRAARELFTQALASNKALGNELGAALVLSNIAEVEFSDGNPEQALRAASEALDIRVRGKNATDIASSHCNSAAYRIALGDLTGARDSAREGLRVARQGRVELLIAITLQHLAVLAALGGNAQRGARLLGYAGAQYTALGMLREPTEQWGYDKLMATLRETLSLDEIVTLQAEGAAWSEDRAVEEALKV